MIEVGRIEIKDVTLVYRDGKTDKSTTLRLSRFETSVADVDAPLSVALAGVRVGAEDAIGDAGNALPLVEQVDRGMVNHHLVDLGDEVSPEPLVSVIAGAVRLDDHAGSVIRLHDDGRVPVDNPFIKRAGARPETQSAASPIAPLGSSVSRQLTATIAKSP